MLDAQVIDAGRHIAMPGEPGTPSEGSSIATPVSPRATDAAARNVRDSTMKGIVGVISSDPPFTSHTRFQVKGPEGVAIAPAFARTINAVHAWDAAY
jgi:hypothetical protein